MIVLLPITLQHDSAGISCLGCKTSKRQLPESTKYGDLIDVDLNSYDFGRTYCVSCNNEFTSPSVYSPSHNIYIPTLWLNLSNVFVSIGQVGLRVFPVE